jgi:hypothetical protein
MHQALEVGPYLLQQSSMLKYLGLASWSGSVLAAAILGSARPAESLSNAVNQKTVSTSRR